MEGELLIYIRSHTLVLFCSCDLGLDPMTFIYKLHLYILKRNRTPNNELQTLEPEQNRQTHIETDAAERITIAVVAGGNECKLSAE